METTAQEQVVLVDANGRPVGVGEKLAAHRDGGRLHLAFSVYVFNTRGQLLLQRRAAGKYHFAGLWSNSCCGHPRPAEAGIAAARRRLGEEFGFEVALSPVLTHEYRASDPVSGLTEHEFLEVFAGEFAGEPRPNENEMDDWRWCDLEEVHRQLAEAPETMTPWLKLTLDRWPG